MPSAPPRDAAFSAAEPGAEVVRELRKAQREVAARDAELDRLRGELGSLGEQLLLAFSLLDEQDGHRATVVQLRADLASSRDRAEAAERLEAAKAAEVERLRAELEEAQAQAQQTDEPAGDDRRLGSAWSSRAGTGHDAPSPERERVAVLTAEVAGLKADRELLAAEHGEVVRRLAGRVRELEEALAAALAESAQREAALAAAVAKAEDREAAFAGELARLRADAEAAAREALSHALQALEGERRAHEEALERLRKERETEATRAGAAAFERDRARAELVEREAYHQEAVAGYVVQIEALGVAVREAREQAGAAARQAGAAAEARETLRAELEAARAENDRLRRASQAAPAPAVVAGPRLAEVEGQLKAARERIAALEAEAGGSRDRLDSVYRDIALSDFSAAPGALEEARHELARSLTAQAKLHRAAGELAAAVQCQGRAREVLEAVFEEAPEDPVAGRELSRCCNTLGLLLRTAGRPDDALRAFKRAKGLYEAALGRRPDDTEARSWLGAALNNIGLTLRQAGHRDAALEHFRQAMKYQRVAHLEEPQVTRYREFYSNHCKNAGGVLRELGRTAEAAAVALERRRLWDDTPAELYEAACELASCVPQGGVGEDDGGRAAEWALEALGQAVALGFSEGVLLETDTRLNPLRSHAGFSELLAKVAPRAAVGSR